MAEKQIVEFVLDNGSTFLIEVDDSSNNAIERVALPSGQVIFKAKQTFEAALDGIKPVASTIISKLKQLNEPVDEVEIKFGIKLTADFGAIFTSIGSDVSYEITLKWREKKPN